jgi:hypothetical protein
MRLRARLALVLALSALPVSAFAQSEADKNQARVFGQEGQQALEAHDYKTAEDKFRRAYTLFPNAPTLALGLARALAGNGKVVASEETYNKIIRDGAPPGNAVFLRAVDDAKREISQVSPRVAHAIINVTGPESSKVTLDDQPLTWAALGGRRPVDPGAHVVKATAEGYKPAETRFTASDGKDTTVTLTLTPTTEKEAGAAVVAPPTVPTTSPTSPATPPAATPASAPGVEQATQAPARSTNKTLGIVALGVGGAGLAMGVVTGMLALGKHSDLNSACAGGTCDPSKQSDVDSYHTMGTLSTVGFIVGGVGAAAGAVLLLTAPKHSSASAAFVSPYIGPGSVGATGRF